MPLSCFVSLPTGCDCPAAGLLRLLFFRLGVLDSYLPPAGPFLTSLLCFLLFYMSVLHRLEMAAHPGMRVFIAGVCLMCDIFLYLST